MCIDAVRKYVFKQKLKIPAEIQTSEYQVRHIGPKNSSWNNIQSECAFCYSPGVSTWFCSPYSVMDSNVWSCVSRTAELCSIIHPFGVSTWIWSPFSIVDSHAWFCVSCTATHCSDKFKHPFGMSTRIGWTFSIVDSYVSCTATSCSGIHPFGVSPWFCSIFSIADSHVWSCIPCTALRCSGKWLKCKVILPSWIYTGFASRSGTIITTCELPCFILFSRTSPGSKERETIEKFKLKIYVSVGYRNSDRWSSNRTTRQLSHRDSCLAAF